MLIILHSPRDDNACCAPSNYYHYTQYAAESKQRKTQFFGFAEYTPAQNIQPKVTTQPMTTDIINCPEQLNIYPADETFVFIDVETSNWYSNTVCAIGLILVQNGASTGYYSLINPHDHITFTYIHGITDDDVRDAPELSQFWLTVAPKIPENFIFVAHNYHFDLNAMRKDLARYGIEFAPKRALDTMWVAKDILYNFRTAKGDLRLNTLSQRLGVDLTHHNAASDITATKLVLEKLLTMGNRRIDEFVRTLAAPTK